MPAPIDGNRPVDRPNEGVPPEGEVDGEYGDFDNGQVGRANSGEDADGADSRAEGANPSGRAQGSRSPSGRAASEADVPEPTPDERTQILAELRAEGHSEAEVRRLYELRTGEPLSDEEAFVATNHWDESWNGRTYSPRYRGYAEDARGLNYGSSEWNRYMAEVERGEEARSEGRRAGDREGSDKSPKLTEAEQILILIKGGFIERAMMILSRRTSKIKRLEIRMKVMQKEKLTKSRGGLMRRLASESPPRQYTGTDPIQLGIAADRQAKYTQLQQTGNQLLGELRQTAQEMDDSITESARELSRASQFVEVIGDIEQQMWARFLR